MYKSKSLYLFDIEDLSQTPKKLTQLIFFFFLNSVTTLYFTMFDSTSFFFHGIAMPTRMLAYRLSGLGPNCTKHVLTRQMAHFFTTPLH
jgi:hypothetical protein